MLYSPVPMHIPDNFLSIAVSLICWAITAVTLGIAISRTNKSLGEKQVPLMGVMAAFIFAAQMINFPVLGGTSGHLLGGVLAAITLGPWAGMLVMTAVIAVQGLLFQDGGLIVMGANILNMGILTCAVGYGLYRSVLGSNRTVKLAVIGVAATSDVGALLALDLDCIVYSALHLDAEGRHVADLNGVVRSCVYRAWRSIDHRRGYSFHLAVPPRSFGRGIRICSRQ